MLGLSVKGQYAVSAMVELAAHYDMGPIQSKAIAQLHCIPQNYLEQILCELKKAGFVQSFRGVNGGYALAKAPSEITVLAVLQSMEGPCELENVACELASLKAFWGDVHRQVCTIFDVKLSQLLANQQKLSKMVTYAI